MTTGESAGGSDGDGDDVSCGDFLGLTGGHLRGYYDCQCETLLAALCGDQRTLVMLWAEEDGTTCVPVIETSTFIQLVLAGSLRLDRTCRITKNHRITPMPPRCFFMVFTWTSLPPGITATQLLVNASTTYPYDSAGTDGGQFSAIPSSCGRTNTTRRNRFPSPPPHLRISPVCRAMARLSSWELSGSPRT